MIEYQYEYGTGFGVSDKSPRGEPNQPPTTETNNSILGNHCHSWSVSSKITALPPALPLGPLQLVTKFLEQNQPILPIYVIIYLDLIQILIRIHVYMWRISVFTIWCIYVLLGITNTLSTDLAED